jgi:uncharacterized protein YndB with AHSA1/START domain/flagellar motility protein MotE (MotC chaperone)
MDMTTEMRFEQRIQAEPVEVYRMFTNSTAMREWLSDRALASPTPGGCLYLEWQSGYNAHGWFTDLQPSSRVAFRLHGRGEPAPSQVSVWIEPGEGGSRVTLVHSELGEGGEWETARKDIQVGWEKALNRLVNAMEEGPDLRITTRPMLGIFFSGFTAEIAKRLHVPVSEGLLLTGTVDGLGAQKAGLQKDDVIVAMGEQPVKAINDITAVLQVHKAGDVLRVTYYRGAERCETEMALSQRPLPEIPKTVAGLAQALRDLYQRERAELDGVLKDVSEAEAAFKPAEKEWSVNEILAHLIHSERGVQNVITELFLGVESIADGYGDNVDAYVKATADAYQTMRALVDAFHASREETVGLIANLPETFAQRKSSFWRLGYQLLSFPLHVHEHADQIKATIEKARA